MSVMTLFWSLTFFKFYFKGFCFLYWTKKTQHFLHNENWQLMWLLVKCISVWDNLNSDCNSQTYKTYNCSLWVFGFWSFKSQFVRVAESPKWLGFQVGFFLPNVFPAAVPVVTVTLFIHQEGKQRQSGDLFSTAFEFWKEWESSGSRFQSYWSQIHLRSKGQVPFVWCWKIKKRCTNVW